MVLLIAAVAKCQHCDPWDARITRLLERLLPGAACEALIFFEFLLGLGILFGGRKQALALTVASGVVSAVGNAVLWLSEGNIGCGCIGSIDITHAAMVSMCSMLVLLALLGRRWGVASSCAQLVTAYLGLGLALSLGLIGGRDSLSGRWWPAVSAAVADGDVILFGSSSCEVCATIARSGRLRLEDRVLRLESVILIQRDTDNADASRGYKAVLHVPDSAWWAAVGPAAPAAYAVAGKRVRRVALEPE